MAVVLLGLRDRGPRTDDQLIEEVRNLWAEMALLNSQQTSDERDDQPG